jgi:hypothetical protein
MISASKWAVKASTRMGKERCLRSVVPPFSAGIFHTESIAPLYKQLAMQLSRSRRQCHEKISIVKGHPPEH